MQHVKPASTSARHGALLAALWVSSLCPTFAHAHVVIPYTADTTVLADTLRVNLVGAAAESLQVVPAGSGISGAESYVVLRDGVAWGHLKFMPKHRMDEHFLKECTAAAWAGQLGFAPAVLGDLCGEGILVTRYLENTQASWHEGGLEPKRSATLKVLAQLHAALTPADSVTVDIDAARRRYEKSETKALAHAADPARVARLSRAMALIFEEAQSTPYTSVMCHGDPHPENVVMHGDRAYLIDWAYAHRGDPMTDLAYFASHIGLAASDMHTLVADYGDHDPAHVRRAAVYLTFMHASHFLNSHLGAPWFTPETQREAIACLWEVLERDFASLYGFIL